MNNKIISMFVLWVFFTLWNGVTLQAQAPHPERIYLSGTGIDDTRTWDFFCSAGQNSGKWKRSKFPVIGSYRDLENIPTDVGTR